jgi:hypothetical protein
MLLATLLSGTPVFGQQSALPARVEAYLNSAGRLSAEERTLLVGGNFWAGLEIRALVPDPQRGTGFWFVTVSRCRSDGLSGFTGMFVPRRVRSGQEGALAGRKTTKQTLERSR